MSLQNSKLFELFNDAKDKSSFYVAVINELDIAENLNIKAKINAFFVNTKQKWKAANYTKENFLRRHSGWLSECTVFENLEKAHTSTDRRGRPSKSMEECSSYTRKRKLQDATEPISTVHLSEALSIKYAKDQETLKSSITKAVVVASPVRLQRIKESIPTPPNALPRQYTLEEGLALFMDLGLSKEKYAILKRSLKSHNVNILLGYKKITAAKKEAVPNNFNATDVSAEVKLKDLMDHTAKRLIKSLPEAQAELLPHKRTLINKWGCDGSSGQSSYKQTIATNDTTITDANMFMASVVPLRLRSEISEHWKNPRPSSVHFCRPISFRYVKESAEIIKATVNDVKAQIDELKHSVIKMKNGKTVEINYEFFLTMIDGKVLNAITNTTSTLKCAICQKTQKDFQKLDDSTIEEHNYKYGISPLHARIRCMEFVLKLAYTIPQNEEIFEENTTEKEKQNIRKKKYKMHFTRALG